MPGSRPFYGYGCCPMRRGRVVQAFWAWRELHRAGYAGGFRRSWRVREVPEQGLWRFVFGTNASATLDMANTEAGTLLVSHFLGTAAAGLYAVAQQMADVLIKPNTKLLIPAIYPEMARLTARGDNAERKKMVSGIAWLAGGLSILLLTILVVFGQTLIAAIFGKAFVGAYPVMIWMAFAGVFAALAFPLEPLLIAAGKIRATVIGAGDGDHGVPGDFMRPASAYRPDRRRRGSAGLYGDRSGSFFL